MPETTVHQVTGAGVWTPEGYAEALAKVPGEALQAALRGAKSMERELRREAVSLFIKRGVGRGIFGKRDSGAYRIIKVATVLRQSTIVQALELRGFAALQETGGRTLAHKIRAEKAHYGALAEAYAGQKRGARFARRAARSTKRVLAIKAKGGFGFGGELVFRAEVNHPGSKIPRHPFAVQAHQNVRPRTVKAIDSELVAVLQKLRVA